MTAPPPCHLDQAKRVERSPSFIHLILHRGGVLLIEGEELADFISVLQEQIVETDIPAADYNVLVAEHLALQSLSVAVAMLEAGGGQQLER